MRKLAYLRFAFSVHSPLDFNVLAIDDEVGVELVFLAVVSVDKASAIATDGNVVIQVI